MHYLSCIGVFDLQEEVKRFVNEKVKEKAGKVNEFFFEGHYQPCKNISPHIPHRTGMYKTVRYGELDYFCLGREGFLDDGNEIIINIEEYLPGNPEVPTIVKGYWLVKKGRE